MGDSLFASAGDFSSTDTHFRCWGYQGSWNYRLKYEVQLPLKNGPLQARTNVQLRYGPVTIDLRSVLPP